MSHCMIEVDFDMCDRDDGEFYARFVGPRYVTGRCDECGAVTGPRDLIETVIWNYSGETGLVYNRTCPVCVEIRRKIFCSWIYGMIWEDFAVQVDEDWGGDVPLCVLDGLSAEAAAKIEQKLADMGAWKQVSGVWQWDDADADEGLECTD